MSDDQIRAITAALGRIEVAVGKLETKVEGIGTDNLRGEGVHQDHENRIRALEASSNQGLGVWKLLTAGGAIGAALVGACALALRALGI